MSKRTHDISLKSYDDIFETDDSRTDAQLERVQNINIKNLVPFKDHPFKVIDNDAMLQLKESIIQYGVLTPLIVRPLEEGKYEIISGHRRTQAAVSAGLNEVPALVRDMDDDSATVLMVDSNMQRENILPSERAFAFKMKLEALTHQGSKSTSVQVAPKLSTEVIGESAGMSKDTVKRFIRLTYLITEFLDMVDQKKIAFNTAVTLSYLKCDEQQLLFEVMNEIKAIPTLSQAQTLKTLSQENNLKTESIRDIINNEKNENTKILTFQHEKLRKYFPPKYSVEQMHDVIIQLLDQWALKNGSRNST